MKIMKQGSTIILSLLSLVDSIASSFQHLSSVRNVSLGCRLWRASVSHWLLRPFHSIRRINATNPAADSCVFVAFSSDALTTASATPIHFGTGSVYRWR